MSSSDPTKSPRTRRSIEFHSPIRGPWLTSVFGAVLLIGLPIVIITGLLSYIAYGPQFGQGMPSNVAGFRLPFFDWPTRPSWSFRLNQGLHVGLGLILVPVVLAKLWSVIPKLFELPPAKSISQALERLSLLALVGGILFEIATGVLNIQYDYIFGFSFYTGHYWGAWVFIGGFVAHVLVKVPVMVRTLRRQSFMEIMRTRVADTEPEPVGDSGLVSTNPKAATISRRGALALVGGGSAFVALLTVGQTTGGFLRDAAFLIPRGRSYGDGPNDFQINRTASSAGITDDSVGDSWRLELLGGAAGVRFSRSELMQMEQHTVRLPISCVEGWSTVQTWTGVRLRDLAAAAGVDDLDTAVVVSLEASGSFKQVTFPANQMLDEDSVLALQVNGVDLSLDHGFPARLMIPGIPGVHQTKWVGSIEFRQA